MAKIATAKASKPMTPHIDPALKAAESSTKEHSARRRARLRKISVLKLRPNSRQPADRHADSNVEDLMESIRTVGLQEPPLVAKLLDGTYCILTGHRRIKAWQLLAWLGEVEEQIRVWVHEDLSAMDELTIIAAEYFHRQEFTTVHKAGIVVEFWERMKEELGREPSRRELARALPYGKSWVTAIIKIHEEIQNPEVAARVQLLDNPDISLLAQVLGVADSGLKLEALDVYRERGAAAARKLVKPRKAPAGKKPVGRPPKVVTRKEQKDGSIELRVRYRPTMSPADARTAIVALKALQEQLEVCAEGKG